MKYSYRGWRLEVAASPYKKIACGSKNFGGNSGWSVHPTRQAGTFTRHVYFVPGEPPTFLFLPQLRWAEAAHQGQLLRDPTTITWFKRCHYQ